MHVHLNALQAMERRYRGNFINSLGGFKSLVLVGTTNGSGQHNLAVFSSLFHIGADPALCGIIVRPATPGNNTLGNILRTSSYTLNHVHADIVDAAHQCSAKYPEGESEFEATGLTPLFVDSIVAPFVQESRIQLACELVQHTPIEMNGTTLLIGKIIYAQMPDECVSADGYIDIERAGSVTCSGLDSYHKTQRLRRLRYAKTDQPTAGIQ